MQNANNQAITGRQTTMSEGNREKEKFPEYKAFNLSDELQKMRVRLQKLEERLIPLERQAGATNQDKSEVGKPSNAAKFSAGTLDL